MTGPESNRDATRRRGRPPRSARAPLDRQAIATAAVRIAGGEGFPALTMRRLAQELGVTVRALYNVVADRQAVVDLVAAELVGRLPHHEYDAANWEESIRSWYRLGREAYRPLARALLISMDETVTPSRVPVERILATERLLRFLVDVGLDVPSAALVRGEMLLDLFAFSLLIDYPYDRLPPAARKATTVPVPAPWLAQHPDLDVPLTRELAAGDPPEPDTAIALMAERTIDHIARLRDRPLRA